MPDSSVGQSVASPPGELYDSEGASFIVALRMDQVTRGEAMAIFACEHDLAFTEVQMRRSAFRIDTEYAAEMDADGIEEPYDGWPLRECKDDAPGAARYWVLKEECYDA